MFFKKLIKACCLLVVAQLLWVKNAMAWGPGVHTVIALQMIENVRFILPAIAGIISSFPAEYMYGCLAADFFVGKSRMKKARQAHNWEGGFRFLHQAKNDQEAAYAYGFLSHLAADVVAHNYFVPQVTQEYQTLRKKSHLYWEVRADYQVGPEYTRIARNVLNMDHKGCDKLLKTLSGKPKKGLGARKLLFTQSVKFSDRAYSTHHLFFPEKLITRGSSDEFALFMVGLSTQVVKEFLMYPKDSPCLEQDPVGLKNRGIAGLKESLTGFFDTFHQGWSA